MEETVKAIFIIEWKDGTPILPPDIEIKGISAMEPITINGKIKAQIEFNPKTAEADLEAFKKALPKSFVEMDVNNV